jgi:hypothetical protein
MLSTKTITSNAKDNKNKTNRLTHNKNNTAEAQLTDSFGEALYLGLAPQPGREQQKTVLRQSLNWLDHTDHATQRPKQSVCSWLPIGRVTKAKPRDKGTQQKQEAQHQ